MCLQPLEALQIHRTATEYIIHVYWLSNLIACLIYKIQVIFLFSNSAPSTSSRFLSNQQSSLRRYLARFKIHVREATPAGCVVLKLKAAKVNALTYVWALKTIWFIHYVIDQKYCSSLIRWLDKKKQLLLSLLFNVRWSQSLIWQSIRALQKRLMVNKKVLRDGLLSAFLSSHVNFSSSLIEA